VKLAEDMGVMPLLLSRQLLLDAFMKALPRRQKGLQMDDFVSFMVELALQIQIPHAKKRAKVHQPPLSLSLYVCQGKSEV